MLIVQFVEEGVLAIAILVRKGNLQARRLLRSLFAIHIQASPVVNATRIAGQPSSSSESAFHVKSGPFVGVWMLGYGREVKGDIKRSNDNEHHKPHHHGHDHIRL